MNRFCNFLALLVFIVMSSCEKEAGNGNILVTVKSSGNAVPQAIVYIKSGGAPNPVGAFALYDRSMSSDAIGQVYFDDLQPGVYYLYCQGHFPGSSAMLSGDTTVNVVKRFRSNVYDIVIEAQ